MGAKRLSLDLEGRLASLLKSEQIDEAATVVLENVDSVLASYSKFISPETLEELEKKYKYG